MDIKPIDWSNIKHYLAPRSADSHKGDYGHSLLVGGFNGFTGAIMMSAIAAARVGSGLTSVATVANTAHLLPFKYPEIMAHDVTNKSQLEPLLSKATVIGIGPGLGQETWGKKMLQACLETGAPMVADADALNLLADESIQRDDWILTPHPGEAARLLATTVDEVQHQRVTAARQLQRQYGGIIVLKGHHSLVATQNSLFECPTGNPGMASGGMGDILTGVITGLIAQQIPLDIAAQIGVYIHGKAGDLAACDGERGLLATDLLPYLRQLVNPDAS